MKKKFSFDEGSLPPKSVMMHIARQYLEDLDTQTQKRLVSKGYISATKRTMMNYVGRRYVNKFKPTEIKLAENKLKIYKNTLKSVNNSKDKNIDIASIYTKIPNQIQNDFEIRHKDAVAFLNSLDSAKQFQVFSNFLQAQIKRSEKFISRNKLTAGQTDKLIKLNGVLITKHVTELNEEETIENSDVYKNIIKEHDDVYSKLETEKQKVRNLMDTLKRVKNLPEDSHTRRQVYEINADLRSENVKIRNLQNLYNKITERKVNFEKAFAEKQVKQARIENKNFGVSSSYNVLEYYKFPKKSSDGEKPVFVRSNSQEGKMIEMFIRKFMSTFRAQLDRMFKDFEDLDEELKQEFYDSSRNLTTDFGMNLTTLKKSQKVLSKRADVIAEKNNMTKQQLLKNSNVENSVYLEPVERKIVDWLNELVSTEKKLIFELKKLDIDINKITLK